MKSTVLTYLRRPRRHHRGDTGACDTRASESGASAVEYSFLVVAIAAVIVFLVVAIGGYTQGSYKKTCDNIAQTGVANLSSAAC